MYLYADCLGAPASSADAVATNQPPIGKQSTVRNHSTAAELSPSNTVTSHQLANTICMPLSCISAVWYPPVGRAFHSWITTCIGCVVGSCVTFIKSSGLRECRRGKFLEKDGGSELITEANKMAELS